MAIKKEEAEVQLGNLVEDMITGYRGIAASRTEILGGNIQFAVQPRVAEGKPNEMPEGMNLDAQTLSTIGTGIADRVVAPPRNTIELGELVSDAVTGLKGIAVSRVIFVNGCVYYNIQPEKETCKKTGLTVIPDREFLLQSRLTAVKAVPPQIIANVAEQNADRERAPGGPATRAQRPS